MSKFSQRQINMNHTNDGGHKVTLGRKKNNNYHSRHQPFLFKLVTNTCGGYERIEETRLQLSSKIRSTASLMKNS